MPVRQASLFGPAFLAARADEPRLQGESAAWVAAHPGAWRCEECGKVYDLATVATCPCASSGVLDDASASAGAGGDAPPPRAPRRRPELAETPPRTDVAFTFAGLERRGIVWWSREDGRVVALVKSPDGTLLQGFDARRLGQLLDELAEAGLRFDRVEAHRAATAALRQAGRR